MDSFVCSVVALVREINAEIACWDEAIRCLRPTTSNEELHHKMNILENKIHVYKEFVKNVETALSYIVEWDQLE